MMVILVDAAVGAVVAELLRAVLDMKEKAVKLKPTLVRLEENLKRIEPLAKEIDDLNLQLGRPTEETRNLIDELERGKELVLECSKLQWWKFCYRPNYQEELEALDESIGRIFTRDMVAQIARNVLRMQVAQENQINVLLEMLVAQTHRNQRGLCSPPEPPAFTVGFDVPLMELKTRLLRHEVSGSVVTLTGIAGSGKSTLAKIICWDHEVRGKFKENIFFVALEKTSNLNTIVENLIQHNGYQCLSLKGIEMRLTNWKSCSNRL